MKRLIIASVVIVFLGAAAIGGNRILERTLDAELAPLLSRQLGLPVQLAPIRAHALQLKATSPTLIMGDPQDPAVVAKSVEVTLSWPHLLLGDIRLVYASASELMVRPSRWPSSDEPLPDDYRFLDPYLPRMLDVQSGRYVSDSGAEYPVNQLHWQRHASGRAAAEWIEQRPTGNLVLKAELQSLPALLQLAPIEGELSVAAGDRPDSAITLNVGIQPGTSAAGTGVAYTVQLDLAAADMTAHTVATGQTTWTWPDRSATTVPLLDSTRLSSLLDSYRKPGERADLPTRLAAALPRLQLPAHSGHIVINEIHVDDEVNRDMAFDFSTGEQGVRISALTSNGPVGRLTGELSIASDAQGWTVALDAQLQAREDDAGIATQFIGANWLFHTGRAAIEGRGDTWGSLLNSLQGGVTLAGHYHGAVDTPIAIEAQLDKRPGEFALEHIAISVGKGQLSGSAVLSGKDQTRLSIDLQGSHVDLGFLFAREDTPPLPGMALPEYLGVLPELELDVALSIQDLQSPALRLGQASATLERTAHGGKLVASGKGAETGTLNLTLEANTPPNAPSTFQLSADFSQLDIPDMFRQQGLFYSRSTGSLDFHSQGDDLKEVFTALKGKAKVAMDIRSDNDWQRTPAVGETLQFSGNSHLVIDADRIVGVEIEDLDVDSIEQALTGKLSLVAGRSPWFIADLKSDRLNIDSLIALLPKSTEKTEDAALLPALQRLGAARTSLAIKALNLYALPLSDVQLEFVSGPDVIELRQLDFLTGNGALKSQGKMTWKNDRATLDGTAEVSGIDLDQFLIASEDIEHVPVSGSAKLHSEGRDVEELVSNLTGFIDLQAIDTAGGSAPEARRKLALTATRLADGMQADIDSLQWGETELSGVVRYHNTSPPSLEVDIHSGTLSLLPWENAYRKADGKHQDEQPPDGTSVISVARASADFVGKVLLTPLRLLGDEGEPKPGEKLFSSDPLPLDTLENFNAKLSAQLDALLSTVVTAKQLNLTGNLTGGQLSLRASSGELSQGSGDVELALDASATPPTVKLTSTFENVHGLTNRTTFPRSGFVSVTSQGQSEAELAAHASGLVFLELGKGPFDYGNSMLFTANLAATVFQTLIPGIEKKKPELQCGVSVALFQDGKGVTPYGFAARTNQANLLGRIHVDLGQETMQMSLDSRGRQGAGISVGSIFSNTIKIKGPLSNPGIVPDTTGLLWRGWAAVMTGGLSVLGETLIKRVLASENPCKSIKELIVKDLCPVNPLAASSPLVCPTSS